MNRHAVVIVAGLLLAAGLVSAAGLDASKVSPNALWVLHVDVEGVLGTQVGAYLLGRIEAEHNLDKLNEFIDFTGFDPRTDLYSVTLWGVGYSPSQGVAVIQGNWDAEKLIAVVAADGYQKSTHKDRDVHSWTQDPEHANDDGVRWASFWSEDILLITQNQQLLHAALDALDANEKAAPQAAAPGAFLVVAAEDLQIPAAAKASSLRNITAATIELGESQGTLFFKGSVTATSETDGAEFRQMLNGMLAFAKMSLRQMSQSGQPEPAWAPLVNNVTIGGEGAVVKLSAEMATANVISFIEAAEEAKQLEIKVEQ